MQEQHINELEGSKSKLLEFVIDLANINSGSYHIDGLQSVAKKITSAFTNTLDCQSEEIALSPLEQVTQLGERTMQTLGPLLRFRQRQEAPVQVLLVGHFDTVFGKDDPFQTVTQIDSKTLKGPGVSDMKGGIAVILWALKCFEQDPLKEHLGWEVILTPDEEIGSPGSAPILLNSAKAHQVGLVFEPAIDDQGTLAGQRKGSGKYTIVATGKAAHVGRKFHEGKNAICALAQAISRIDALNDQQPGLLFNVGTILGGSAVNVVPEKAGCRIDIRLETTEQQDWALQQLRKIVKETSEHSDVNLELFGRFGREPKLITGQTEKLYQLVKKISHQLGHPLHWQSTGGCCDGNTLSAAGLANVDTLGVCGGGIHSSNEYLLIDSLVERAKLTVAILQHLAKSGGLHV